jgi:hypothetical protein
MRRDCGIGMGRIAFTVVGLALCALCTAPRAVAQGKELPPPGLRYYPSRYYEVYSDLEEERVTEAVLRMSRMAEEYHERTKEFSGVIRTKFPFYLFKNPEDYYRNGGPPGSFGVFMSRGGAGVLMSQGGDASRDTLWHAIQHEGFHQFARAVIGGDLPAWLNEGMAEYFGEAAFTGDGFVSGVMPPDRGRRIQNEIREKRFKSVPAMMTLSQRQWNAEIDHANYDMAWSMVHFLVHGDDGKYAVAFGNFIKDVGRNARPWEQSWLAHLGPADGFEKKWSEWWLAQDPALATRELYAKSTVAALASFLGRAGLAGQSFDGFDSFLAAAKEGSLKSLPADWLPQSLLTTALDRLDRLQVMGETKFALVKTSAKLVGVSATLPDETRIVATFSPKATEAASRVTIVVDDLAPRLAQAKALVEEKKKDQAKLLLKDALRRNPQSPLAPEAQKLLRQLG